MKTLKSPFEINWPLKNMCLIPLPINWIRIFFANYRHYRNSRKKTSNDPCPQTSTTEVKLFIHVHSDILYFWWLIHNGANKFMELKSNCQSTHAKWIDRLDFLISIAESFYNVKCGLSIITSKVSQKISETPVFLFSLLRIFDRIFDVIIDDPYLT